MLRAALVAGLVAAVATGCAPAPAWRPAELPDGFRASSLAAAGGAGLLVGGVRPDRPAPALLEVAGGRVARELQLRPAEPYAEVAELVSVTADGDRAYAIGRAFGGAHSNPRLTLWDGSLGAGVLTSRPQEFFTFGGHDAGPLLGTVALAAGPVVVGSRTTTAGAEGVLWTLTGTTWHKHTDLDPALASSPDRVLGFSGAAGLGDRLVLAGDEVGLAGPLRQRPSVWAGRVSGGWTQAPLPVPDDPPAVGGQLNRATGVACGAGGRCWVAGWVHGRPVAWAVDVPADGRPAPGPAQLLPGEPPEGSDPVALVALAGDRAAVLTNAVRPTLQLSCPGGWAELPAPPGSASALVEAGGTLYAVTAGQLWRLDAPRC